MNSLFATRNTWPCLLGWTAIALAGKTPTAITARGWFSDEKCATSRVADGRIGPTGVECARKCLARGVKLAFIDENAKAVFIVDNSADGKRYLGDHVEIRVTRASDNTLHVRSIKVLENYVAKCDPQ